MFSPEEQNLVRLRLADCLKATVSQRLLNRMDGKGRVVAQEIMVTNTAISECIADPLRTNEIPIFIENSQSLLGSQTFHQHLSALYREGIISLDVAKQASANASDFEQSLNYEKNDTHPEQDSDDQALDKSNTGLHFSSVSLQLENSPPIQHEPVVTAPADPIDEEIRQKTGLIKKVLRSVKNG